MGNGASLIDAGQPPDPGQGLSPDPETFRAQVEAVFRQEHASILARLVRRSGGDFFVAEDALAEAMAQALEAWPRTGVPEKPAAWIQTVANRRLVDGFRRQTPAEGLAEEPTAQEEHVQEPDEVLGGEDDRLRLLFTCCHPALDAEARVALTLNALCGLKAREVARALLVGSTAMAQRLVRAKRKIKQAKIPYRVPDAEFVDERLATVLRVLYLLFNEGYSATEGDALVRHELAKEALGLAGQLAGWMPEERDVIGLRVLMQLQYARRLARTSVDGEWVSLADQDRSLWDRGAIALAIASLEDVLRQGPPGPYSLQAAIAAVHAEAPSAEATDWEQIVALYDRLLLLEPSPVVELNRIVAVAEASGAEEALCQAEERLDHDRLESYLYYHATLGELYGRLQRSEDARSAYQSALRYAGNGAERRFLVKRLKELGL